MEKFHSLKKAAFAKFPGPGPVSRLEYHNELARQYAAAFGKELSFVAKEVRPGKWELYSHIFMGHEAAEQAAGDEYPLF